MVFYERLVGSKAAFLAKALRPKIKGFILYRKGFMATETELFYPVLFVALALIIHVIRSNKGRRGDRKSHS
jgi:hypothetical protein